MTEPRYTYDAIDKDGHPRVFVGMHRPPWPGHVWGPCPVCSIQGYTGTRYDCWQAGHYDKPLYRNETP